MWPNFRTRIVRGYVVWILRENTFKSSREKTYPLLYAISSMHCRLGSFIPCRQLVWGSFIWWCSTTGIDLRMTQCATILPLHVKLTFEGLCEQWKLRFACASKEVRPELLLIISIFYNIRRLCKRAENTLFSLRIRASWSGLSLSVHAQRSI